MWLLASVGGFVTQEQGQRAIGMANHGEWGLIQELVKDSAVADWQC